MTGKKKDAVPTAEEIAEIAATGSFADFEAARRRRDNPALAEAEPPAQDIEPGDGTDDEPGASPGTEADDGDPNAGPKDGEDEPGSLPKGVKRRLERAKRARDLARQGEELWRRRYEEAVAGRPGAENEPPADDPSAAQPPENEVEDEPIPSDEYDFDYPEESDYLSGDDDAEGMNAFLEDVERWEANLPLKGGKHAAPAGDNRAQPGSEQEPGGQQQLPTGDDPARGGPTTAEPPSGDDVVGQLFADLRETLEESEAEGDETLAQDFFDQLGSGKFQLSYEMLEWMADNDDAVAVAREFIKSPRKANRLFRNPPGKHAQLLTQLAQPEPPSRGGGRRRATDNRDGKTVVSGINGRQPADPRKALVSAGSFEEYEAQRRRMDQQRRG